MVESGSVVEREGPVAGYVLELGKIWGWMSLLELDKALDHSNPTSKAEWDRIARDSAMHAVALFAEGDSANGARPELVGSGTLVVVADGHYILTAAHVWEKLALRRRLGISLRLTGDDHSFMIDTNVIVPFGPPMSTHWTEWGPDIAFLRIPPIYVGSIKASSRVFYRLPEEDGLVVQADRHEAFLLLGTPGGLMQNPWSAILQPLWTGVPIPRWHDEFDYWDVQSRLAVPVTSNISFKGLSGGGLWRVQVYIDSSTGKIDSKPILHGVAFWQHGVLCGSGFMRCHGPGTIRMTMPTALVH
jgi:hypothetical protein